MGHCSQGDQPVKLTRSRRSKAEEPIDLVENDPRRAMAASFEEETEESLSVIRQIFDGTSLVSEESEQRRLSDFLAIRTTIRQQWSKAGHAFLTIGRELVRLTDLLTPAEYARFRRECASVMPFSDPVASKFRQIALAVDGGRIPEAALPGHYTQAYELASLDEHGLSLARQRNLVRADVTRSEVLRFRAELRSPTVILEGQLEEVTGTVSRAKLVREKARLLREVARIDAQLAVLAAGCRS